MKRLFLKNALKVGLCFLLVLSLAAFWGPGCNNQGQERGDTMEGSPGEEGEEEPLVIRLEGGDWGYSSPFTHYSRGPGIFKMRLVFDSLMEREGEGIIPWLAEDWEVSKDGKEYVFDIRQGVKWHDGEELTAHDVEFSFKYFQEHPPGSIGSTILDEGFLVEVEALSDYQVKFTTSQAKAPFLYEAGTVRIIPRHIWEEVEDPQDFTEPEAVIGCGPYQLTDYDKEHGTYRFEAFEDFWGPEHKVDVIEFVPVSDEILAFEKGEIDLARISTDLLPRFQDDPEFEILESPGFWGYRMIFNMQENDLFQKKELRQAVAYGIDQEALVEKIERGAAIPGSHGILPRHHVWYNPQVKEYDYDPERAREILEENNLVEEDLSLVFLVGDDKEVRLGEILKEQLSQVGIDLKVESVDMKSRDSRIGEGKYEMALVGHGGWGGDPDYLRTRFFSEESHWYSGNPGYVNEEVDRLCQEQLREIDEDRRKEIIYELQEVLAQEVPEIPLYNTTGYSVFRPEKYDGWMFMFDHHSLSHSKLSYLERE